MDSIFPTLTAFTGGPNETFITLADSSPVCPVQTESVTKAGLTLRPGTRLTVLPKEPSTTPPHLETEENLTPSCYLCYVFYFYFDQQE